MDAENSVDKSDWLPRDVEQLATEVNERMAGINVNVSNHFIKTLSKFNISSGLSCHLSYKHSYLCRTINDDHSYCMQPFILYYNSILKPKFSEKTEDIWHKTSLEPTSDEKVITTAENPGHNGDSDGHYVFSKAKTDDLKIISQIEPIDNAITIKLPQESAFNTDFKVCAPNYSDVVQGSKEWLACRVGIITASKMPALLGLHGQQEFNSAWFCIQNKLDESIYKPKKFKNFERGKLYERAALENFTKASGKYYHITIVMVTKKQKKKLRRFLDFISNLTFQLC